MKSYPHRLHRNKILHLYIFLMVRRVSLSLLQFCLSSNNNIIKANSEGSISFAFVKAKAYTLQYIPYCMTVRGLFGLFSSVADPDVFCPVSAKFLLEICLKEICSKKYIQEPNSSATEIPKVFMAFTHTKKVDLGSFIKARIRIRPKRPGSDRIRNTAFLWDVSKEPKSCMMSGGCRKGAVEFSPSQ
jgi:hypothetical protein